MGVSDGPTIRNHAAFIWSVADKLRGVYKQSEYGRVILPLVVLASTRLRPRADEGGCARAQRDSERAGRERRRYARARGRASVLSTTRARSTSGRLLDEPANIAGNLRSYIAGFSPAARDVLEKFGFEAQITRLERGEPALPRRLAVRGDRAAPGRCLEPRDGLSLRGARAALLGALERDRWRALHAARGDPPDGQPPVRRGRRCCSTSRES